MCIVVIPSILKIQLLSQHAYSLAGPVGAKIQSNLSYPGALGLGGARNSDLSVSQNTI